MAHHDQLLHGDPDLFVSHLDSAILSGSITAQCEHAVDHRIGTARMLVRAYERYSATGGNRVSLCISVLAVDTELAVSAVATGGSQAIVWKLNTFGEEAFLDLAVQAIGTFVDAGTGTDPGGRGWMNEDGR